MPAREIKFRGWHTTQKKMYSAEQMANDQLTLLPTGEFINVNGRSTRLSVIYPKDKFIPLQYTGLKDKNGKEIYEGDSDGKSVVKKGFYDMSSVEDDGVMGDVSGWYIENIKTSNILPLTPIRASDYVVSANIYENPEMLQKK